MKSSGYKYKKGVLKVAILLISFLVIDCCGELERPLSLPFDHGPHFDAVNEWWYFTGVVRTQNEKILGFEFTIFKRWVGGEIGFAYLGHLAVSDPEISEHYFAEVPTFSPVPGSEAGKTEIIINNFSYSFSESEGIILQAEAGNLAVNLLLTPAMDVLPHGRDGIIDMGDGRNSYYYSFTNLMTEGYISVKGLEYVVSSGRTWMDHQWGNYTLFGMIWDWFSLRLEDGSAFMLFQFRNVLDNVKRTNWTYRTGGGSVTYGGEFSAQATRVYKDVKGNSTYPIDWIVEIPAIEASFLVTPLFDEQSLYEVMTPRYWEGLCSVKGSINGEKINGSAYVELTGYRDMDEKGDVGSLSSNY